MRQMLRVSASPVKAMVMSQITWSRAVFSIDSVIKDSVFSILLFLLIVNVDMCKHYARLEKIKFYSMNLLTVITFVIFHHFFPLLVLLCLCSVVLFTIRVQDFHIYSDVSVLNLLRLFDNVFAYIGSGKRFKQKSVGVIVDQDNKT